MNKLYASRPRKLYAALFTLIETLLISFIVFGVGNATVNCYSAVVLAFLVSIPFLFENKKENGLITCALFFTVVADFFLVILYGNYGGYVYQCLGVSAFVITHAFYAVYLFGLTKKRKLFVILRAVVPVAVGVVSIFVLKDTANYLSVSSAVCFSLLVLNIISAFIRVKRIPFFAVGLLLFSFCDILVGLQCADGVFFTIPSGFIYSLVFPPFNAIWLFYGLAQTLIVLQIVKPFGNKVIK